MTDVAISYPHGFHEADARVLRRDARFAAVDADARRRWAGRLVSRVGKTVPACLPARLASCCLLPRRLASCDARDRAATRRGRRPERAATRLAILAAEDRRAPTPGDLRPHSSRRAQRRRPDRAHRSQRARPAGAARADRRHRAEPEACAARNPRRGRQRHRPGGAGLDTPAGVDRAAERISTRRSPR